MSKNVRERSIAGTEEPSFIPPGDEAEKRLALPFLNVTVLK